MVELVEFCRERRQRLEALRLMLEQTCCRTRTYDENREVKLNFKTKELKRSKTLPQPYQATYPLGAVTQPVTPPPAPYKTSLIEPITPDGVI